MAALLRFFSFRPFTGRHMLFVMVTFFGVVIAVNLFMATMAARSWTGLIVKNGYIATKFMEERRERESAAVAAGWRIGATVREGIVTVEVVDGADRPLDRALVDAVAGRPVMEQDDRRVRLDKVGYGRYVAREPLPVGRWYLDVRVMEGDLELTRRFSFVVEEPAT